ncbi:axonemal dynein light intermediate polypeptide 1 [Pelomyxa schiedti]|nr:axonemal dynein light intermediate polypeptide 1 [Pelomyxa schiedti]
MSCLPLSEQPTPVTTSTYATSSSLVRYSQPIPAPVGPQCSPSRQQQIRTHGRQSQRQDNIVSKGEPRAKKPPVAATPTTTTTTSTPTTIKNGTLPELTKVPPKRRHNPTGGTNTGTSRQQQATSPSRANSAHPQVQPAAAVQQTLVQSAAAPPPPPPTSTILLPPLARASATAASDVTAANSGVLPGLGDLDRDPTGNLCDILDAIVPKREFMKDSTHWEIHASTIPATRNDVILLAKEMQKRLVQRQARGTGLCPIRRELYSQLFDEIIRQETVNCTERGILLTHVRNELHTTLHAYLTLYESGIAFGLRKALDAEQGRVDLESKIATLEAEKQSLETQVAELKAKCEYIEKRDTERRQEEEKKHAEEVAFLKKVNLQLKAQLESVLKKT